jgi:hypothetical protein
MVSSNIHRYTVLNVSHVMLTPVLDKYFGHFDAVKSGCPMKRTPKKPISKLNICLTFIQKQLGNSLVAIQHRVKESSPPIIVFLINCKALLGVWLALFQVVFDYVHFIFLHGNYEWGISIIIFRYNGCVTFLMEVLK